MNTLRLIELLARAIAEEPSLATKEVSLWLPDAQDTTPIKRCFISSLKDGCVLLGVDS